MNVLSRFTIKPPNAHDQAREKIISEAIDEYIACANAKCPHCGIVLKHLIKCCCPACYRQLDISIGNRRSPALACLTSTAFLGASFGWCAQWVPALWNTRRGNTGMGVHFFDAANCGLALATLACVLCNRAWCRSVFARRALAWVTSTIVIYVISVLLFVMASPDA